MKPSAAQLRARRLFVERYGHKKKKHRRNHLPYQPANRMRHNAEGEHEPAHHMAHAPAKRGGKTIWILLAVVGGFILLRGTSFASVLGGGTGGYTPVGTDASGRPIYTGPVGGAPPPGYTQTGVTSTGQPVYTYTGSTNALGVLGPVLGGVATLFTGIGKIFTGGSGGGVGTTGSPVSGGGSSTGSPDILNPVGLPDINLPDISSYLPDISFPDLTLPDWLTGGSAVNMDPFNFEVPDWVPSLDLNLTVPTTPTVPDFPSFEF